MTDLDARGAYAIASQWGSYQHAGDPGACFYSFHVNDGRPVHQGHRNACLARITTLLFRVGEDIDRSKVTEDGAAFRRGIAERRELKALKNWFEGCPLRSAAA